MSKHTDSKFDFSAFDADPELSRKRHISVPPPTQSVNIEQRPYGFTPMGEVDTDGQTYRGLSRGKARWWVILTSWLVLGVPSLLMSGWVIRIAIQILSTTSLSMDWGTIITVCMMLIGMGFALVYSGLILLVLVRGTKAKIRYDRQQRSRKWVTNPRRSH